MLGVFKLGLFNPFPENLSSYAESLHVFVGSATAKFSNQILALLSSEKAGIYPLLDVDDMVSMRKPDWKCVFTYVQSIYRRFKDER
ncbi:jg21934 [Pararge aegeria aegeria]|uniref:Jg21934 protein n=1 Tax=Pararge aegeria aegeria TaxID=348720 RepID=A0A8S4QK10_9NEOP|nr:jg21934 [Pararge aegeria aegeria]